jgi:Zn-dependent protease with chaperone function
VAESTDRATLAVNVRRWPSERPLFALVLVTAIGIWIALAVSLIGIAYAAFLMVFFFIIHLSFITYLRGNAVRLGPDQMPELYERIVTLSKRVGLKQTPDAYVMQAGGVLNALATKFFGSKFIVLYTDLLEACGENTDASDFIIAHELGHLRAGHLRWHWLLIPGLVVPFLGTAYSRAREYTSDRFGFAASANSDRSLDGLCILAAGGESGPKVNRRALVAQRADLNTVWMKIGHWLSSHPPIAHRLAELEPSLATGKLGGAGAAFGAVLVLVSILLVPTAATIGFAKKFWPQIQAAMQEQRGVANPGADPALLNAEAEEDIMSLVDAVNAHQAQTGRVPANPEELYTSWAAIHPDEAEPLDPYDGARFGYHVADNGEYWIWSVGPDAESDDDDIYYTSESANP